MGFVLDWQKKLGYKSDPFVEEPLARVHDYFVGRDEEREKLNLFIIKQHAYGILQGGKGVGKTSLLRWLHETLQAYKVPSLFIEKRLLSTPKLFTNALLEHALNVLEKKVSKPHEKLQGDELQDFLAEKLAKRRLVLLIDDANDLSAESVKLLKKLLSSSHEVQVILALERTLKAHEELGEDELAIVLDDLDPDALVQLLARRIGLAQGRGTFPFDDDELDTLIGKAKRNPSRLLALARDRAIELSLKVKAPVPTRTVTVALAPQSSSRSEPRAALPLEEPRPKAPEKSSGTAPGRRRWFAFRPDEDEAASVSSSTLSPSARNEDDSAAAFEGSVSEQIDPALLDELVAAGRNLDDERPSKKEREGERLSAKKKAEAPLPPAMPEKKVSSRELVTGSPRAKRRH